MDHPYNGLDLLHFVRRFLLCHDFSVVSIKEIRELTMLLLLSEFGVITNEQIHLVIIFTDDMKKHSKNTLSSITSRLCSLDSFNKIKKDNTAFIQFSKTGPIRMLKLLKKMFGYLNDSLSNHTSDTYLLERAKRPINGFSTKTHSIQINTAIILAIFFRKYDGTVGFYIRKELNLNSFFSNKSIIRKEAEDIYPDFLYMPYREKYPVLNIEVDLGTEDISSNKAGSILNKIKAYTFSYCNLKADVVFLFEDKNTPYISESQTIIRKGGYSLLSKYVLHRAFTHEMTYLDFIISMAQGYAEVTDTPLCTVDSLLKFMQRFGKSITRDSDGIEHSFLYELLVTIAKYVDQNGNIVDLELDPQDQGLLPLDEVFSLLEYVKQTVGSKRTSIFNNENPKRLSLKRNHIYKAFMDSYLNYSNLGKTAYGVMDGMVLGCSTNSRFWKNISYIFFNETTRKKLGTIVKNLSIIPFSEDVNNFCFMRPLITDCPPNNYTNSLSLLSMRNTFRIGDIDICIENISEDLGGFIRVQNYLKLPFGVRPNTLVIALVDSSDNILANGQTLQSGSIFYLPKNNGNKNVPICSGETPYWPYQKERLQKFVQNNNLAENNYYLPLALNQTQELIFLSYIDWNDAMRMPVVPWIYDHEANRIIQRKPLMSKHKIESHLLSSHRTSGYHVHKWT